MLHDRYIDSTNRDSINNEINKENVHNIILLFNILVVIDHYVFHVNNNLCLF